MTTTKDRTSEQKDQWFGPPWSSLCYDVEWMGKTCCDADNKNHSGMFWVKEETFEDLLQPWGIFLHKSCLAGGETVHMVMCLVSQL